MAPVASFVPEIVTSVLRSPFFRRNKTPRKDSDNTNASPSTPLAGPSDAAVLQSSPRVATLENHVFSASVESVKEPPAVPPSSFASLDTLASQNSLRSSTRTKLEPIIEQPTPGVTPGVTPAQEKEQSLPVPESQNSLSIFSSPTTIEKPQAHIVNDSPSSRIVTFVTAPRVNSMRTGASFQSFSSPYPQSVDKMGPADMLMSSDDECSPVFATPPATPTMGSEYSAGDSPPAVVLVSPSLDCGLILPTADAFTQPTMPSRLSAPLRSTSGSTSDSRPAGLSRSSTGYSSDTGNASSLPITPLDAPSANDKMGLTLMWVGENAIEPIGIPLPTTYAEARSLATAYPEIAEEILKRPLAPSRPPSRAPSSDSRVVATPSPAPTSDADDADDERSQICFPSRRREHSPDHPNWALAPDEPSDGWERKRQRGRGREHQTSPDGNATGTRQGGKQRNRRTRGRKSGPIASFEQHLRADASTDEIKVSPAQVMVESLLRDMKELGQSSKAEMLDAGTASRYGRAASMPLASDTETNGVEDKDTNERREAMSKLMEARKTRDLASATTSPQDTPKVNAPGFASANGALREPELTSSTLAAMLASLQKHPAPQSDSKVASTPDSAKETYNPRTRNPRTATVEDVTDEDDHPRTMPEITSPEAMSMGEEKPSTAKAQKTTKQRYEETAPVQIPDVQDTKLRVVQEACKASELDLDAPNSKTDVPLPSLKPNTAAFSPHSRPSPSSAQQAGDSPTVKLPTPSKTAFSATAPEFIPSRVRKGSHAPISPDATSGPTPRSGFTSSPSPFASFATNPAAAAIVNIANYAHSSAAELAKQASIPDLAGAAKSDLNTSSFASSVMSASGAAPPMFSPPIANVTAAVPPSMIQPAVSVPAAAQASYASPVTGPSGPIPVHAPVTARGCHRRGSSASLSTAASTSGPSSLPSPPVLRGGLPKRASMASLHQPMAPSPLARQSPIVGPESPKLRPASFAPQIHAPKPMFGEMSKRPSVANLAAAAAAPPFVPGPMVSETVGARGPPAAPATNVNLATNNEMGGGSLPATAIPVPTVSYAPATTGRAICETPQRPAPNTRESSPAYAWTPATRPVKNQASPSVVGQARQRSAGGALAGYDVPPPLSQNAASSFATAPPLQNMASQVLADGFGGRERTVTTAMSPAAPLPIQPSVATQAEDTPVFQVPHVVAVQNAACPSVTVIPVETRKDLGQEAQAVSGYASQAMSVPEQNQRNMNGAADRPATQSIEVNVQGPEDIPVRPPTPGGQASLTQLVSHLQLPETDSPLRPTSVVPGIHAGTPDQPAHWTIDEEGKLRAKKTDGQPETERPPPSQRPAGPPPLPRRRARRDQPEAYKPYFQNAGQANTGQANERYAGLRRHSMLFARDEGGIRGEHPDRDREPGDAQGGPNLWRRGSGKWRKKYAEEDEEDEESMQEARFERPRRGRERTE